MSTGVTSAVNGFFAVLRRETGPMYVTKVERWPGSATCSATVPKVKASTAQKPYCTLIRIMMKNKGENNRPKLCPMGMASSDESPWLTYQAIFSHWAMIGPANATNKATGKYHFPSLCYKRPEFKYRITTDRKLNLPSFLVTSTASINQTEGIIEDCRPETAVTTSIL